jgi:hypothetical protein
MYPSTRARINSATESMEIPEPVKTDLDSNVFITYIKKSIFHDYLPNEETTSDKNESAVDELEPKLHFVVVTAIIGTTLFLIIVIILGILFGWQRFLKRKTFRITSDSSNSLTDSYWLPSKFIWNNLAYSYSGRGGNNENFLTSKTEISKNYENLMAKFEKRFNEAHANKAFQNVETLPSLA